VTAKPTDGEPNELYALPAATGAVLWHRVVPGSGHPVGASGGLNYFNSEDNSVYAGDATTGETVWHDLDDGYPASTVVPDAAGGTIYAASTAGDTQGVHTWLYAFDARTGATRWCWTVAGMILSHDNTLPLPSGPVVCVALGDGQGPAEILGLDGHDGHLGWSVSTTDDFGDRGALMANGVLFVMKVNGDLVALQPSSGATLWQSFVAHGDYAMQTPTIV
jgi:outer membrane protein assembly factor BamB